MLARHAGRCRAARTIMTWSQGRGADRRGGKVGRRPARPPSGARFRTYERLKRYADEVKGTLFDTQQLRRAIDDIYRYPAPPGRRRHPEPPARSGISDEDLAELVVDLREEDRLCLIHEEEESQEPQIICSLGLQPADRSSSCHVDQFRAYRATASSSSTSSACSSRSWAGRSPRPQAICRSRRQGHRFACRQIAELAGVVVLEVRGRRMAAFPTPRPAPQSTRKSPSTTTRTC